MLYNCTQMQRKHSSNPAPDLGKEKFYHLPSDRCIQSQHNLLHLHREEETTETLFKKLLKYPVQEFGVNRWVFQFKWIKEQRKNVVTKSRS